MLVVDGQMDKVLYARLDPGQDLFKGIQEICLNYEIVTGVVLSITGALEKAVLQRFKKSDPPEAKMEVIEVPGPLEASGHGTIGRVHAPSLGKEPFGLGRFVHGEPYIHVHLVVTSGKETICGHLMEGCPVQSKSPISHFTIAIARVKGIQFLQVAEGRGPAQLHHDLIKLQ
jgi:predicted DNA-binding protein with PD1-like motif